MSEHVDDGSDKPIGNQSSDGELEVRAFVVGQNQSQIGYCETGLGQHQRWMRQAPDLYEKYQEVLTKLIEITEQGERPRRRRAAVKRADLVSVIFRLGLLANEVRDIGFGRRPSFNRLECRHREQLIVKATAMLMALGGRHG